MCGEDVECMISARDEALEIHGWSCRSGVFSKCRMSQAPTCSLWFNECV